MNILEINTSNIAEIINCKINILEEKISTQKCWIEESLRMVSNKEI